MMLYCSRTLCGRMTCVSVVVVSIATRQNTYFNCMRGGFVIVKVVSWGKTRALLEKGVTSDYQPSITTTYQNLILPRE